MKFKNFLNEENVKPKIKADLLDIIKEEIKTKGYNCDLNFIDTSLITDMSFLFSDDRVSKFNGDISKWNVSNVKNMSYMFVNSKFNGDISKWNVSKVERMDSMFMNSNFNGDISKWNVSNIEIMDYMFDGCPLKNNPPEWYKD